VEGAQDGDAERGEGEGGGGRKTKKEPKNDVTEKKKEIEEVT